MLEACQAIGVTAALGEPGEHSLPASTPITGDVLFSIAPTTPEQADHAIAAAAATFTAWRSTPAPVRGALVARLGELLTAHQQDLATLVTVEVGKITAEARGEVQEMIDVCQFSVGLSRQLYGRTIASERAGHRLLETWHPLGVVGVITAFNFPVAVWAWNTAVALVCGDTVVWKPSELTPLTALACQALLSRAAADVGAPAAVGGLLLGGAERGAQLVDDPRVALLSATGSVRMGQQVGPRVARRFGRVLLELGGNNAAIVAPSADLELAVRGIVFAAAGTAGQRCTSLRRLIVHRSVADDVVARVVGAYRQLAIGDPSAPDTLVGPLIHEAAYRDMVAALERARTDGGEVIGGDRREVGSPGAYYTFGLSTTRLERLVDHAGMRSMRYRVSRRSRYGGRVRTGISASVARELRLSSDALRAARSRMRRGRSAMRWRLETSAASRLTTRSTFLAFADSRQSRRRYAALSSPIRGYLLTDSRYLAEPVVSQQGRRGRPTPPKEPPPPARLAERVVYVSNICHMATARRRLSPQDRRAELLALGAEVFGKRPYDEVRIDEIAERAGVSRALMYHYFPDKRAFFAAVVKDEADRLYAATNKAPAPGMTMFEEIRTGVLAYMAYHQQNPEAAWAAYVGLGRSDPVLLGIDDEAKNRQMEHIMSRIAEVVSGIDRDNTLDPEVERDLRVIIHGWLAFTFELCRQRIMDPSTDAERLADACAHALLDAISRLPQIPAELADAMATARM